MAWWNGGPMIRGKTDPAVATNGHTDHGCNADHIGWLRCSGTGSEHPDGLGRYRFQVIRKPHRHSIRRACLVERCWLIPPDPRDPSAASIRQHPTMNATIELRTAEVKALKENPDVYGGEEPHQMVVWADEDGWDDHPHWVIDYLEAGGWMKHFPDLGYDEESDIFTVHYNPEERNDIRKLVKPDGTEITDK